MYHRESSGVESANSRIVFIRRLLFAIEDERCLKHASEIAGCFNLSDNFKRSAQRVSSISSLGGLTLSMTSSMLENGEGDGFISCGPGLFSLPNIAWISFAI